jgi:hypothetical protein
MADELNKPSRGTGDWDIPVNDNFDTLEAAARAFLPRGTTQTLNVADISSDNINNSDTITSESVNPQFLADNRLFAGNFAGSNPDARLTNALNAATQGDTIFVETAEYSSSRNITTDGIRIAGSKTRDNDSPRFEADIELSGDNITVVGIAVTNVTVTLSGNATGFKNAFAFFNASIIAAANACLITEVNSAGDVTFQSGTTGGLVDSCQRLTVTDNGSNTVGDIA